MIAGVHFEHEKFQSTGHIGQSVVTLGHAQSAALGHGVQNIFLGDRGESGPRIDRISLVPPLGRRSAQYPLRGRDELLHALERGIETGNGHGVIVIHGLAGSGKTSVALEIAHNQIARGVSTWWISGNDAASLEAGMLTLAGDIGVSALELSQVDPADAVWRALLALEHKWLLIIDNANDPAVLAGSSEVFSDGRGWVRPGTGRNGAVVLTSQLATQSDWGPWCTLYQTTMLGANDGAQMLLDYLPNNSDALKEARTVVNALGGLPLAIRLAGLYLSETGQNPWPDPGSITTLAAYESALNDGSIPGSSARDAYSKSLNLSLQLLDQRGLRYARPLLNLLSFFADAVLPYDTLLDPQFLRDRAGFNDIDGRELWRTLSLLIDLGMADPIVSDSARGPRYIRVHPVVQRIMRISELPSVDLRENFETAASLLSRTAGSFDLREGEITAPFLYRDLAPHVKQLAMHATSFSPTPETAELLVNASCTVTFWLLRWGVHREAEAIARVINAMASEIVGNLNSVAFHSAHDLARILIKRDRYQEADEAFAELIQKVVSQHGDSSERSLEVRHEYADFLVTCGEASKSIKMLRAILKQEVDLFGRTSERYLTTKNCLAIALHKGNKIQEATEVFSEVLAVRTDELGEDHISTVQTRHDYAHALGDQGLLEEDEALHREVLLHTVDRFGDSSVDALEVRHCLSHILALKGELPSATVEVRAALDGRTELFGESHPRTLEWRRCLATLLDKQGEHAAAYDELRAVLGLFSAALGDEHSATLRTRHSLAHSLAASGDLVGAQREFASLYAMQKRVLGSKHEDTRDTKFCLDRERKNAAQTRGAFPVHGTGKSSGRKKRKS